MPQDVSLSSFLQGIAPILITAPTARNGITLLQRLLNSAPGTIVFGENTMLMRQLPQLVLSASRADADHGAAHRASMERFLARGGEYWSSDLSPDTAAFVKIALGAFAQALEVYARTSADVGRPRWGIKNPMTDPEMIDRFRLLLPRTRVVFIHRHLFDVARSAKARQFVRTADDLGQLAEAWQTNLLRVLDADPDECVHVVSYAHLVARPDEAIAALEAFTGAAGIDRAIMERRINTFEGEGGYIEPVALTDDETALLHERAAVGLARIGAAPAAAGP